MHAGRDLFIKYISHLTRWLLMMFLLYDMNLINWIVIYYWHCRRRCIRAQKMRILTSRWTWGALEYPGPSTAGYELSWQLTTMALDQLLTNFSRTFVKTGPKTTLHISLTSVCQFSSPYSGKHHLSKVLAWKIPTDLVISPLRESVPIIILLVF